MLGSRTLIFQKDLFFVQKPRVLAVDLVMSSKDLS